MDGKAKLATVLIAGYLLGRTKKMKLAITVAGALGGRQLFHHRDDLIGRATKLLDSSPGAQKIASQLTTTLVDAATGAAVAAASKGISSLSDNLLDRAENLRKPKAVESSADEEPRDADEPDVPEDEDDETQAEPEDSANEADEEPEDSADEADEEPEEEPEKPARRQSSRSSSSSRTASGTGSRGGSRSATSTRRSTSRAQGSSSKSTKKSSSA